MPNALRQRRRGANGLSTSWTCVRRPVRTVFVKYRDEHWRDILQKIFRFVALENGGVLPQLIGDLVNDKLAVRLKRIVRFSQQCALLLDLENAKRNAGENVIARSESAAFQLVRQRGRIAMNHMHASIACKLPFQCARQRRVEFKQEQMRIRCHPSRDLTRVHAFAGPYSAITRGWVKSILLATRSTIALELGTIEAI